jgi:hypothetical protein
MFTMFPVDQFRKPHNISAEALNRTATACAVTALLFFTSAAYAERSNDSGISTELLSQRLSQPWGMTWLTPSQLFITEKYVAGG